MQTAKEGNRHACCVTSASLFRSGPAIQSLQFKAWRNALAAKHRWQNCLNVLYPPLSDVEGFGLEKCVEALRKVQANALTFD
jgi:hypothetical protein